MNERDARLIFALARVAAAVHQKIDEDLVMFGLTLRAVQVLRLIAVENGVASVSDAARRFGITKQSMSHVIANLEEEGMIMTTRSHDRHRPLEARLTPFGQAQLEKAVRRIKVHEDILLGEYPAPAREWLEHRLDVFFTPPRRHFTFTSEDTPTDVPVIPF